MKFKLFLILLLLNSLLTHSQSEHIDSLILVLHQSKNDIDRTKTLNALSDEYKTSDPKQMKIYAEKALTLSKKKNYRIAEGNAYLNLGNSAIISGNYPQALDYFLQAQGIFEKESNIDLEVKKSLAKSYGSIGVVFSEQSNYAKALHYYLRAARIYEAINDLPICAKVYNNIGVVYKSESEDFKALTYFIRTQKIQEQLNDPNIGITYTNIANGYLKLKDFEKAFDYYNKAKISLDTNPNPRALGEWYNNFGLFFKANNKSEAAIKNWNLAITTFKSIEDKFGLADTHIYLSQLYLEQNKLQDAFANATQALQLAKELGVLEQIMLSEKLLSSIYMQQHNPTAAFEHFKLYSIAKDSLTNAENIRKGVEAEMNYEYEKREVVQKKEIEKRELLLQEQSKQSKLQLFFAVLFGLLLFGIGFLIYSRIQLRKNLTLQKELAEYEQKALHLQMNPHFVFNCLGSISSFIVNNGTESAIKYLAKFSKLMRLTLEYSKESLIPIDKEIESLQNYLELEQLRFNHKFNFTIIKSKDIEDDVALPPLLLQPFIENAIIHGVIPKKGLGQIDIHFSVNDKNLICIIEDNGIGFEKSKAIKENSVVVHKSMALDITKKRLQMIASSTNQKADFSIDEIKNNNEVIGTKVLLHLPIQYIK
jgi:pentatricopeptide repeat protein